jgi:hypothetical protein
VLDALLNRAPARSVGVDGSTEAYDCRADARIEQEAECPEVQRWRTHPGVGPLTGLALVRILGRADRFQWGKEIACYLGLVPLEDSSGDRRSSRNILHGRKGRGNCPLPLQPIPKNNNNNRTKNNTNTNPKNNTNINPKNNTNINNKTEAVYTEGLAHP